MNGKKTKEKEPKVKVPKEPKLKKQKTKEPKAQGIKRPNGVVYFFVYTFIYPVLKICYGLKSDRKGLKMPKGPYIVLSNHMTMHDFILVMLAFYPRKLNAVAASKFFMYKPLHKFMPLMGCIPKNMFDPDVRSVMSIKSVLKRGDGVLLFPEGRCSSTHAYVGIHKATGKLIKKLGVPVISSYLEGVNNCMAHWRKRTRFGRVRVTFRNLFSAEDLKELDVDEINAAIDLRLGGPELTTPPKKPFATYRARKLADGLDQFLYFCPKCEQEFVTETDGNTIRCKACGFSAVLTRQGKLVVDKSFCREGEPAIIDDVTSWMKKQVQFTMKSVDENMSLVLENVKVRTPVVGVPGGGTEESGLGNMRLDPEGWHFDGTIKGEAVSMFFPIDTLPAISYDHCDNFQLYHEGNFYIFIPEDPRPCFKYVIMTEGLHRRFASKVLLTPGVESGYFAD